MGSSQSRPLSLGRCIKRRPDSPTCSELLGSPYISSSRSDAGSHVCSGSVGRPLTEDYEDTPSPVHQRDDQITNDTTTCAPPSYEAVDCDVPVSSQTKSSKHKTWAFKIYDVEGSISQEEVSSVVGSFCGVIGSSLVQNIPTQPVAGAIKMKLDLILDHTEQSIDSESPVTHGQPSSTTACDIQDGDAERIQEKADLFPPSPIAIIPPIVVVIPEKKDASNATMDRSTPPKHTHIGETLEKQPEIDSSTMKTKRTRKRREKMCGTCAVLERKPLSVGETVVHVHHHQEHTHQHHHSSKACQDQITDREKSAEKSTTTMTYTRTEKPEQTETNVENPSPKKKGHRRRSSHRHPRTLEDVSRDMLEVYLRHKLTGKCSEYSQLQSTLKSSKSKSSEKVVHHVHHHHHHTHHHHHHHHCSTDGPESDADDKQTKGSSS